MFFPRILAKQIEERIFKGKCIIVYGARQVGKTTLLNLIKTAHNSVPSVYLNCDEPDVRLALSGKTSTELKLFVGERKLVLIDEAQRVQDIGLTLKLLVDNYPDIQVVATGSSSLDLSNKISETLTGRKHEFHLYPFSFQELLAHYSGLELNRQLENVLQFGLYPMVVSSPTPEKQGVISEIAKSYLYRDVLEYQYIKRPEMLERLLQALALQIGQEVSYTELANLLKIDKITVEKYIGLLEQSFIIFRLTAFSRNLRKEIGKARKIYFFDLGIRNSLIKNFNKLSLRNDVGHLWENFLVVERIKANSHAGRDVNNYFWRTYDQKEVDYIEEYGGVLDGYEFKLDGEDKFKVPKVFLDTYKESSVKLINKNNYLSFVGAK